MPTIRILSDRVANQIAAGEVIERPAAVVKELVENSLDAGATRIEVEFRHGGRSYIRIEDNGKGMTKDDALLSLERHATSKLVETVDLDRLVTFGFRGEAVPSIASVSARSRWRDWSRRCAMVAHTTWRSAIATRRRPSVPPVRCATRARPSRPTTTR